MNFITSAATAVVKVSTDDRVQAVIIFLILVAGITVRLLERKKNA